MLVKSVREFRRDLKSCRSWRDVMLDTEIMEFPREEVEARVQFMMDLIPKVGRSLLTYRNEIHISNSESIHTDLLLMQKADRFAEERLISAIQNQFPDDSIVSEEAGNIMANGEFTWYLDPVDGSRNFIHGVPQFAMSAGLVFHGSPIAGVIHVPVFQETYHAIQGGGAYKNDTPINVSAVDSLERSLVSNGLPYKRKEILSEILANISAFITSGIGLRRTGSAVLDMCWIAEGRFDAMWDRDLKSYDTCAASVILTEAGGRLSGFNGDPYQLELGNVVASNGLLHKQIVKILMDTNTFVGHN